MDAGGELDGERHPGGGLTQDVDHGQGDPPVQRVDVDQRPVVEIDDRGPVRADRHSMALHMGADDLHPAGGPPGDEEDLDPRLLGGCQGGGRTVGQGLVVP